MDLAPELEAFVRDARSGHLATVDEAGRPHVVPVCFIYQEGAVYSVLDAKPKRVPVTELRRVRNLVANPEAQLLVDHYDEDWSRLRYVQLRGTASLLTDGPENDRVIAALRAKYAQYLAMAIDASPVIKLTVQSVVSWQAKQP